LQHVVTTNRIPTGIARLDAMLGGKGFFRGSSVLVSGTAGTGKSSISAHFVDAACRRGERALYFSFEESPSQIIRNMRSIGIDLEQWVNSGLLRFQATRPAFAGLEMQLTMIHKATVNFNPQVVIVDPLNGFIIGSNVTEVKSMLTRLADFLKTKQISSMFTQLISSGVTQRDDDLAVSSMIDTWLLLRDIEIGGERNRGLYIIKSRGMAHSNQVRECLLTDRGVELCEVYVGAGGVLTGSARLAQEAQELALKLTRKQAIERRQIELESKRRALDAQITALRAEFDVREAEAMKIIEQEQAQATQLVKERVEMGVSRKADL
jgi:circadian clock protein KaiC